MRKLLTDKAVASLKPAKRGRYIVADTLSPLLVRVTDKGNRTYMIGARLASDPKKHFKRLKIATVGAMTLAEAREAARVWTAQVAGGRDPRDLERKKRAEAASRVANTFAVVAEDFIARHLRGKRVTFSRRARDQHAYRRKSVRDHAGRRNRLLSCGNLHLSRHRACLLDDRRDVFVVLRQILDSLQSETARLDVCGIRRHRLHMCFDSNRQRRRQPRVTEIQGRW